jgi:hypothetical protein
MVRKRLTRQEERIENLLSDMSIIYSARSHRLTGNYDDTENYPSDKRLAEYVIDWGRFWLDHIWIGVAHAYRRKKI